MTKSPSRKPCLILVASSAWGRIIAQHLAVELGVTLISEIFSIESADTFGHASTAGRGTATVQNMDAIKVLTVRTSRFETVSATGSSATVRSLAALSPGRPGHPAPREASGAADDKSVFCGYYGPLGREWAANGPEARQFDRGDPQGIGGPGLRAGLPASRNDSARGAVRSRRDALDFLNPGL